MRCLLPLYLLPLPRPYTRRLVIVALLHPAHPYERPEVVAVPSKP
ncbi:hypothetical protein E5Q_06592 [Mixia osmundae IAM 14324]|uniref:Uncharacterized protein n=1 Tax=Mixia osmundae (strain CBS 9802 / IAM 14324 / JCM 22182 / KY 12970) TaxID=764103 RepID=G7EAM9_MIXOS|nr:hypothetical protein E5Q_06592 [Mixia osmundae IAM 14324]